MEKLNPIEKAFEKVRKNSSINDASEMVTKFLTTEIAYNELKRIVDDSNLNISKTHQRIAEIEENLEKAENLKPQSELKDALQKDIINKLKTVSDDKNNLMKFKQIHEKITNWSWKMLRRLGNNEKSQNLIENLKLIKNSVSEVQKRIKENVMDIQRVSEDNEFSSMPLKKIINCINIKDLKKLRCDSLENDKDLSLIIRDLGHSSPQMDSKTKKYT